ncbi:hypothetical protein AX15_002416 [Amanita polypyramis BW_CC]|nr:hypothetical protein AX15_002416 [Amanita polypyramis BW_CC]
MPADIETRLSMDRDTEVFASDDSAERRDGTLQHGRGGVRFRRKGPLRPEGHQHINVRCMRCGGVLNEMTTWTGADRAKLIKEGYRSSAVICTFIAGVQAQLIAITYNQTDLASQIANAFFFAGLFADIGASILITASARWFEVLTPEEAEHMYDWFYGGTTSSVKGTSFSGNLDLKIRKEANKKCGQRSSMVEKGCADACNIRSVKTRPTNNDDSDLDSTSTWTSSSYFTEWWLAIAIRSGLVIAAVGLVFLTVGVMIWVWNHQTRVVQVLCTALCARQNHMNKLPFMAILSKPLSSATNRSVFLLIPALLLLRSRIAHLPWNVYTRLAEQARGGKTLAPDEILKATQQVYENDPDGAKTLLVLYRDRLSRVRVYPTLPEKFAEDAPYFPPIPSSTKSKPNIDASFLKHLRAILLRIVFPHLRSKETLIVVLHSFFLVLRTVLSIAVAKLDGVIVRDLVKGDGKGFLKGLGLWFLLAIPSTYTNSMIRHLQSKLSLRLRTRLTRYIHDLYLSSFPYLRYYRSGLDGVDQYITADVEAWSESLSGLYGNILKPSLDLVLFTSQLSRSLGVRGTILLFANYYATITILRAVTPAFGRLAAVEARLEGEYRAGMGRIGREAEEIAFYNGGLREKNILTQAYLKLIRHVNSIYKIRIAYEWTEDYVIKYLWSAAGYGLIAVPLLYTRTKRSIGIQTDRKASGVVGRPDDAIADRTETYFSNRRLLLSLADAGGRLMYAYKDILELAGLTTRLYTLISTLHNLPPLPQGQESRNDEIVVEHVDVRVPSSWQAQVDIENGYSSSALHAHAHPPLVKDLSFILKEGEHLMITGSNGVGKTSVARVLAGLWPPESSSPFDELGMGTGGTISRPPSRLPDGRRSVFIVPQRSYMVSGSLLDQVIYPDSYADFVHTWGKHSSDGVEEGMKKIGEILEMVHLGYLPEREGGWFTRKEWRDVLSGGEKQRVRIFIPRFVGMDCTFNVPGCRWRWLEHSINDPSLRF